MDPADLDVDHVLVRLDGRELHLGHVFDFADVPTARDALLVDASGAVAWTPTARAMAVLVDRLGCLGEGEVEAFATAQVVDLDGLVEAATAQMPRAACRRLHDAWEVFDLVAETAGRPFSVSTADEDLHGRLTVAALGGSWWARLRSRPTSWSPSDVEHLRHVMSTGLDLFRHRLAPAPSTEVRPVLR